jgi:hypothetical protein
MYVVPYLFFFSAAVVVLALLPCRAHQKSALPQPGLGACFMVTIATVLYMAINAARKLFYGTIYAYDIDSISAPVSSGIMDMASLAGYFVVALWVIQVIPNAVELLALSRNPHDFVLQWSGNKESQLTLESID